METEAPTATIAETTNSLLTLVQTLATEAQQAFDMLARPWNGYQLLIIAAAFVAAHLAAALFGEPFKNWMRARQSWPKWRLRVLLVLHRRLRLIFFVLFLWIIWAIMQETTWPSRSYVIGLAARLSTAWLIVAFITRLVANPALRGIVRAGAWAWVSLSILGLTEDAARILDSIALHLGTFRISVWMILQGIFIIGVLFFAARFLSQRSAARLQNSEQISPSMRVLTIKLMQVLLYGSALFLGLKAIGVDLTGLAVLSGAIGVGLGFGLQKVVSNLVSGVILLLDKSIKPGDVISIGETFGWINTLGARYVSITTRDGKEFLIPNEDLITGQVVNWSHSNDFVRLDIHFGTAYHDDPHAVRRIAIDAAASVDRVLGTHRPVCHIVGFGDSSVDYILRFWIKDPTDGLTNIRGNVYLALWDAFQEHGISIPFPQREVKMLQDTNPLD